MTFLISPTMLKKQGVPAYAKIMMLRALMASTKGGFADALTSISKGPVWGAALGRSDTPHATARVMTEDTIETTPTQPIQEILSRVWILDTKKAMIAPTTTKTTVQVPCTVIAFIAIENDSIPEPAMAVSINCIVSRFTPGQQWTYPVKEPIELPPEWSHEYVSHTI